MGNNLKVSWCWEHERGEVLLSLCAPNELTIINTINAPGNTDSQSGIVLTNHHKTDPVKYVVMSQFALSRLLERPQFL